MATKYPKSIGGCIDLLYTMTQERLAAQKTIEAMKKKEDELELHILDTFSKDDLIGAKGKVATAGIKKTITTSMTDWNTFIAYVAKKKAWDMLRRQPSVNAVKERWDAGEDVPGVEPFTKISLSLTKAGS